MRPIKPPPSNWKHTLPPDELASAWKYAAGETPNITKKQANAAHCTARKRVWNVEKARLAGLKDEKDRTDQEKDDLLRFEHPAAYEKSRVGNKYGTPITPPYASWKSELSGAARTEAWKYAAGVDEDGNSKTPAAHALARAKILRDYSIEVIKNKAEIDWTDEDRVLIKDDDSRKASKAANGTARYAEQCELVSLIKNKAEIDWTDEDRVLIKDDDSRKASKAAKDTARRAERCELVRMVNEKNESEWTLEDHATINEYIDRKADRAAKDAARSAEQCELVSLIKNKAEIDWTDEDRVLIKDDDSRKASKAANCVAFNARRDKLKMDICIAFNKARGFEDIEAGHMSEHDISNMVYDILTDDTPSPLFEALGNMTLAEAFYYGDSDNAIYVSAGRGDGGVGGYAAEGIRFLVHNKGTTVLTDKDGNDLKYSSKDFKDLDAEYFQVGPNFKSYSDCTALESILQLILNFLELGRNRLWLKANTGRFRRPLRSRDMQYIEKLEKEGKHEEASKVVFCVGITLIKNVSVLSRVTDDVSGKDIVTSIKAGLGTTCMVHQPLRLPLYSSKEQKDAVSKLRARLGPNYTEMCRKRKFGALDEQPTNDDGIQICKNGECSADSDSESDSDSDE
jgi:hypothetical protein